MYVPLEMRIVMVREPGEKPIPLSERPVIDRCSAAVEFIRESMIRLDREAVVLLLLNAKNRLLGTNVVSLGTQGACIVGIPEVFKAALLSNARGIILVHNHPSGDPSPSEDDKRLSRAVAAGGKIMNIPLLDSIILGEDSHFSFVEQGLLSGSQE